MTMVTVDLFFENIWVWYICSRDRLKRCHLELEKLQNAKTVSFEKAFLIRSPWDKKSLWISRLMDQVVQIWSFGLCCVCGRREAKWNWNWISTYDGLKLLHNSLAMVRSYCHKTSFLQAFLSCMPMNGLVLPPAFSQINSLNPESPNDLLALHSKNTMIKNNTHISLKWLISKTQNSI